jgi:hypothetical protein
MLSNFMQHELVQGTSNNFLSHPTGPSNFFGFAPKIVTRLVYEYDRIKLFKTVRSFSDFFAWYAFLNVACPTKGVQVL